MSLPELTRAQERILSFIVFYLDTMPWAPTWREIGEYFDIRPNAVLGHTRQLIQKGYITKAKGQRARTMQLTEAYKQLRDERIEQWRKRKSNRQLPSK
jgi:DNA-binding MarR family transcriptional regulator